MNLNSQAGWHEVGIGGYVDGIRMPDASYDRELKRVQDLTEEEGSDFLLQGARFMVKQAFDDGRIIVYRINNHVVGAIEYQPVDLEHRIYGSVMADKYRVNELRRLVVSKNHLRSGVAARLVRAAQLIGTVESPLAAGFAMRAIATVAAVRDDNRVGLQLAENLSATVCTTECPIIHNHGPLRAYAITTLERVQKQLREFPFRIIVLRTCDLYEAGRIFRAGRRGASTTAYGDRLAVEYHPSVRAPDWVENAALALARHRSNLPHDPFWIDRLGLQEGKNSQGLGNAYYGDVTPEMVMRVAA